MIINWWVASKSSIRDCILHRYSVTMSIYNLATLIFYYPKAESQISKLEWQMVSCWVYLRHKQSIFIEICGYFQEMQSIKIVFLLRTIIFVCNIIFLFVKTSVEDRLSFKLKPTFVVKKKKAFVVKREKRKTCWNFFVVTVFLFFFLTVGRSTRNSFLDNHPLTYSFVDFQMQ